MLLIAIVMLGALLLSTIGVLFLGRDKTSPTVTPGASAPKSAVGEFGRMPAWAQKGPPQPLYTTTKQIMQQMNASGKQIDFLLYGDSLTSYHINRNPRLFAKYFGGWHAAALGVPGNDIEHLAWRIMSGAERPAHPPKVLALHIGLNNSPGTSATNAARLEELVAWLQRAYPPTRIVIVALLPEYTGNNDYESANKTFEEVAKRKNVVFAQCGQSMNPRDTRLFPDGRHPSEAAYNIFLPCLKSVVQQFV